MKLNIGLFLSFVFVVIALFLLLAVRNSIVNSLEETKVFSGYSKDESYSYVTCVFTDDCGVTQNDLDMFLMDYINSLDIDGYGERNYKASSLVVGEGTVENDKTSIPLTVYGVDEDYFYFHPFKLVSGYYFNFDDDNTNKCVIDSDTAWRLFGSSDICGKEISVNGHYSTIIGVVLKPDGKLYSECGYTDSVIYTSTEAAASYCLASENVWVYEALLYNPIEHYAMNKIKEKFDFASDKAYFMENSDRFLFKNSYECIRNLSKTGIDLGIYRLPYFENLSRVYRFRIDFIDIGLAILLLYDILLFIIWVLHCFLTREKHFKDLIIFLSDYLNRKVILKKRRGKKDEEF